MNRPSKRRRTVLTFIPQQEKRTVWSKIWSIIKGLFSFLTTLAAVYLAWNANKIAEDDKNQKIAIAELAKQTGYLQKELNVLRSLNEAALQQANKTNDLLRANVRLLSINENQRKNLLAQGRENIEFVDGRLREISRNFFMRFGMDISDAPKEVRKEFYESVLPMFEREISNVLIVSDDSLSNYWSVLTRQVRSCLQEIEENKLPIKTQGNDGEVRLVTDAEKEKGEKYHFKAYFILYNTFRNYLTKKYPLKRTLIEIDNPYPKD